MLLMMRMMMMIAFAVVVGLAVGVGVGVVAGVEMALDVSVLYFGCVSCEQPVSHSLLIELKIGFFLSLVISSST
jgi:hypothetical protein